ncbi:MAG: Maf family protein [Actinomycetes bacterium]|nr:septum formation inhibitor Maf [Acidimicrobiia bacterium]
MTKVVLASGSPRRSELLALLDIPFEVQPADVDESRRPGEEPLAYVERLARDKARAVAREGTVAVGADTIVVHRGTVMGKPEHPAEARAMLERLSGDVHQVMTAVAVAIVEKGRVVLDSTVETALVRFLPLTDREIDDYIATGEPLDKAGAYALQGRGAVLVESIEGHPTTVVGLPLPATRRLLARAGVSSIG